MGVVRQLPNYELTTTRTCSDNFQVFFFLPAFQPLRYEVHPFFFFYRKPLLTSTTRDQIIHVLHKITSKFLIVAFFCYRSELSEVFLTYSNSFQLLLHLCQFLRQDFHFFLQLFGFFHSHPFLISTLLFSRLSQLQQKNIRTTAPRRADWFSALLCFRASHRAEGFSALLLFQKNICTTAPRRADGFVEFEERIEFKESTTNQAFSHFCLV